jgi:C_GCAxxG_C_C family probable redox protein
MFHQGYSCSQAVLCAFAGLYGLDHGLALKLSAPFAGGMGRQGRQCGATTGALMVLGLHGGRTDPDDEETRNRNDALVVEFLERFAAECGSLECNNLTGVDMSDTEARAAGKEAGVFDKVCPGLVERAAGIVAELLER